MLKLITHYINDSYGSKKGLVRYFLYRSLTLFGCYRKFKRIDWGRVERLVFVCQGNICRSPLACVYAKDAGMAVDSYGVACKNGSPADSRVVGFGKRVGLDLGAHESKNISEYTESPNDLVVVMEPRHLQGLSNEGKKQGVAQFTLAGLWLRTPCAYIHDPFNTTASFFDFCSGSVVAATRSLLKVSGK